MANSEKKIDRKKIVAQMTTVGVAGNLFMAAFKFFAGIVGHSTAMISDAIHTSTDVCATFIAWLGVQFGDKGEDADHPYGHERYECVAALTLGLILLGTGLGVGYNDLLSIINKTEVQTPTVITIVAAILSIAIKEAMFWYTMYYAKLCHSTAFKADAWHHRGDALSSVGALIGIIGARMGYPVFDKIAGVIICLVIVGVGIGTIRDAISKMIDTSCDPEYEAELKKTAEDAINNIAGLSGVQKLFTRKFGEKLYTDIYIYGSPDMNIKEADKAAAQIRAKVMESDELIKFAYIHIVPAK